MNPLELFEDPDVTDILIDSNRRVHLIRAGRAEFINSPYSLDSELQSYARQIIRNSGGRIDIAKPFAEVNLSSEFGDIRFHAILGGDCASGTQVSIRRHPMTQQSLESLFKLGSINSNQLDRLEEMVVERSNFVIIGPTGSGKTTLLRAILNRVAGERIVTIEDTRELRLNGAIELFTRAKNSDGFGEISLDVLIREALRMRPDRLVVGEARGVELATILQALNTGHNGVGFTFHAADAKQAVSRTLHLLSSSGLDSRLAVNLLQGSVNVFITLNGRTRAIEAIGELAI